MEKKNRRKLVRVTNLPTPHRFCFTPYEKRQSRRCVQFDWANALDQWQFVAFTCFFDDISFCSKLSESRGKEREEGREDATGTGSHRPRSTGKKHNEAMTPVVTTLTKTHWRPFAIGVRAALWWYRQMFCISMGTEPDTIN